MLTSIVAVLAFLATVIFAQIPLAPFNIYTMQVLEMRIPYRMHNVSFTINAPNNTQKDGGDDYGLCAIGWFEGDSPQCWTQCKSRTSNSSSSNPQTKYLARLDKYNNADEFNVSIWQSYPGHHNTGLATIRTGKDGYYCSHGAQTDQCSLGFPFKPIKVPATKYSTGCEPTDFPVC